MKFCKQTGYEKSLPVIDEWLQNSNPNVRRAVTGRFENMDE